MGRFEEWLRRQIRNNDNLVDRALLAATEQRGEDQIRPDIEHHRHAGELLARQQALEEMDRAETALRAMLPLSEQIALAEDQKEEWRFEMPEFVQWRGEHEDISAVDADRLTWMDRMYGSRQWRQVLATLPGWEPHEEGDYHINMDEVDYDDSDLAVAWSEWDRLFGAEVRRLKREYGVLWQRIPRDVHRRLRRYPGLPDGNILRAQRANGPDMIREAILIITREHWRAGEALQKAYEKLQTDRLNYIHFGCNLGMDRKRKFDDESRRGGGGGAGALAT